MNYMSYIILTQCFYIFKDNFNLVKVNNRLPHLAYIYIYIIYQALFAVKEKL